MLKVQIVKWQLAACVLAALVLVGVPARVHAQYNTGTITGTVEDPSNAAVPDAQVTALHVATGVSRKVTTNGQGEFVFNSMTPGEYTITISAKGFKSQQFNHLTLSTGQTLSVPPVKLVLGQVTQTVTAYAESDEVQTTSSEHSELISSSQAQNLVVRGRNFTDLTTLLPGVIDTAESQDISTSPAVYVNGNRDTSNAFFIDGIPSDDNGNGTQMKDMISQDALSEVQVLTSNYQAEYGRQGGSVILAVTKSGTREFHGLVSYFNRNEDYNANNYFNNRNGIARPIYRYNTITYNIGGPVFIPHVFNTGRNKLFFFWNQEIWPTKNNTTGELTVPNALERQGNFSQSYQPNGTLYTVTDPSTGKPFPNNTIPSTETNSNGLALLNLFPLPNFTNTAVSKGEYNYVYSVPVDTPLDTQTLRIDYPVNDNNTISGSYNLFNDTNTGSVGATANTFTWPEMIDTYYTDSKAAMLRWLHIFSPNALNEFHFGFLKQPAAQTYTSAQLPLILRSHAGFNVGQFFPSANPLNVLPNATFGGVPNDATISIDSRFPLSNRYYDYTWLDDFAYTRGSHNMKAGISYELFQRIQKVIVSGQDFNGVFNFQNSATNPLNTGYAYGNAALGNFYSYQEASVPGWQHAVSTDLEWYVQDNWRVTPRLSLNYGLRFYYIPPFYEAHNQISAFTPSQYSATEAVELIKPEIVGGKRVGVDPATGTQYPAADIGAISPSVGNPADGMATPDHGAPRGLMPGAGVQLGPRFGFAYDVFGNGRMAVRGGFGIFPSRPTETPYFDDFTGQPPLAQNPILYYGQLSSFLSGSGLQFPGTVYGGAISGRLNTIMNYSLGVETNIGFGTIVDVSYVGSQGRHLTWNRDLNAEPLGADFLAANQDPTKPGSPLPSSFYRPYVGYNSIYQLSNGADSNYNSLQITAQRRFTHNLDFGVAYTWSKALDYADANSADYSTVVPIRAYNYSLAGFDTPQLLEINYIYDLPNLRSHVFAPARAVLNNWKLSGIGSFQSGQPTAITVTTTTGEDITGTTSVAPRPVLTGNVNLPRGNRTFDQYFNTSVVQLPAVGTYGNAPRLFLRQPGVNDWALGVMKDIPLHDRLMFELRAEAYNAFNHTQFSTVDTAPEWNPTTGAQINSEFGQVTAARDPRELQIAGEITF